MWRSSVSASRSARFRSALSTDIMERFHGIDLDSARRVAGNGFYYLMGDIARLHSAVISYARDFMIDRGFTYCVPPFMIRSNVVTGVMSFAEMDAMMYKIEGEDLYLIGTSEHSMIGSLSTRFCRKRRCRRPSPATLPASVRKRALMDWKNAAYTGFISLRSRR